MPHNTLGDNMNKQIVYIAYLIVFFVIFNFSYGFTDWIASWQMWHWYMVILSVVFVGLIYAKLKQNERKNRLWAQIREAEEMRMQLSQLLIFEQLNHLDETTFDYFLKQVFGLKGFESIDDAPVGSGIDLLMWSKGAKVALKWFKTAPLMSHIYKDKATAAQAGEAVGIKQVREAFGAMKDAEVAAQRLIVISTGSFDEAATRFASRNGIELMDGGDFYESLENLREPAGSEGYDGMGEAPFLVNI